MARLATVATSKAKARAEDHLTRVRDALAVAEEDGRGLELRLLV